jgi:hypothetical protein
MNEKLVAAFLDPLVRERRIHISALATMRRLVAMLRAYAVIPKAITMPTAIDQSVAKYKRFLVADRALSPATAVSWISFVRRQLNEKFEDRAVKLERLSADDVIAFVQRHARRHGSSYTRKLVVSARSFVRYIHYKGLHPQDLSTVVPKVAR